MSELQKSTTKKATVARKKAMIEALEKTLGVITTACRISGVSRQTHYRWYQYDEKYKAQVDDIENIALDFSESKLHEAIKDLNITAIIFHLKTKGRNRGYVERQEIQHEGRLENNIVEWRVHKDDNG